MSFFLFLDGNTPAIGTKSPIIKSRDINYISQTISILSEVRALQSAHLEDIAAARNAAQVQGYRDGIVKAEAQIESLLTSLVASFDDLSSARRDDIATAAFAAVRAIVGALDDETKLKGIVETSLARINSEGPITVEVATNLAERIAIALGDRANITVTGSHELSPYGCRIHSANGRIVADLGIQLDALAGRWGVEVSRDAANEAEL
jgi:flagellar biosynthesis/type III secretory pathway protein FliH